MRRAVIFATLTMLLLAVAGVTVAQEGVFSSSPQGATTQAGGDTLPARETTSPERTVPEATGAEESTRVRSPEAAEKPAAGQAQQEDPGRSPGRPADAGKHGTGPPAQASAEGDEVPGKGASKADGKGRPEDQGKGAKDRGKDEAESSGGGQAKAAVCHKGKKTLSVGAPARDAHLRHGDTPGACA